jgi:CRISPR system Cascade subunit CasC
MRQRFAGRIEPRRLGKRTKGVPALIARCITDQAGDLSRDAEEMAFKIVKTLGLGVKPGAGGRPGELSALFFLGQGEADRLAEIAIAARREGKAVDKKAAREALLGDEAVDVALFGRMVAKKEAKDLVVDACSQVAHAISVHRVETEFDYFTAIDELSSEETSGAGMIGTVEFNSALLYRHANVNIPLLREQLSSVSLTASAVREFIDAFVKAMPTGKQNTFANRTLPSVVIAQLGSTHAVNLVGAFEKPVAPDESGGYLLGACEALRKHADQLEAAYDLIPARRLVVRIGPDTDALKGLGEEVTLQVLLDEAAAEVRVWCQQ